MVREKFKFETLEVYQRAQSLVKHIYLTSRDWPKEYLFDLTAQLRRAALSVMLNIAEGSGRSKKEFGHYLDIARGSCNESVALIDLASQLGLFSRNQTDSFLSELSEIARMLSGLKRSLR